MTNGLKCVYAVSPEPLEMRRLLSGTTYFVAPGGSDSASGDSAHPFQTLQHASDVAVAGDTVDARAGNYAGFVRGWDGPQDGTPSEPVTFHAEQGATIVSRNSKTADGIDVEGASYIIIDGFTVNNASGTITRAGIRSVINTGVVIENNVADHCGTWGIFTGFSENILIQNNVASNAQAQHGIYVSNSADNPIIRGNIAFGNHDCGIQVNADASQGGDGIITGAVIEGNIVHDNGAGGGSAINLDGVQNSVISNNVLYNNLSSGISLFMIDGAEGSKNNTVANNTIVMPAGARWAINIQDGSTGNAVFNNILLNSTANRGAIDVSSDSLPGFSSDYNAVTDRFTTTDGDSLLSLAGWQSASGQDRHSFVALSTQLFQNPAANDYRLSVTSAAIDAGSTADAPATDLAGIVRPQGGGIDIGAYERSATPSDPSTPSNPSVPTPPLTTRTSLGRFGSGAGMSAKLRFQESNGVAVTLSLSGGTGEAFRDSSGEIDLELTDAGRGCAMGISAAGGRVMLGNVFIHGSLRALTASAADLAGTLFASGSINRAQLGSISGGTIASAGSIGVVAAASLSNAKILAGADLGADGLLGAGDDHFLAASIGTIRLVNGATGSLIEAGVDPGGDGLWATADDLNRGGTIRSIIARGGADSSTRFEAGSFRSAALPRKIKIEDDSRFVRE